MPVRAGFAERDITPPLGTHKIGWLKDVIGLEVSDPLFARAAAIKADGGWLAWLQLDTLSVRWTTTQAIRAAVAARSGLDPVRLLVAATHNHAGPAVARTGVVPRDDAYVATLVDRAAAAVAAAVQAAEPAEIGLGSGVEFDIAYNRRIVTRDGTTKTHYSFARPESLYVEGPVDPEVAVLAARRPDGTLLGALVNFACHPTHTGAEPIFSAGFPGALDQALKAAGCPFGLFLNGAAGNIHFSNPMRGGGLDAGPLGQRLAADALAVIEGLTWRRTARVAGRCRTVDLPYRDPTPEEVAGTVFGAQRFVDPAIYDALMPELVERIRTRGTQPAEVQVLDLDEYSFVSIPAEYFAELGLDIKLRSHPRRALVVSCANGMVGYVPHRAAYERGGYETTFISSSRVGPGAGEILADTAVALIGAARA